MREFDEYEYVERLVAGVEARAPREDQRSQDPRGTKHPSCTEVRDPQDDQHQTIDEPARAEGGSAGEPQHRTDTAEEPGALSNGQARS